CAAVSALRTLDIDVARLQRALLDDLPDLQPDPAPGQLSVAPSAARCLQMAYIEARTAHTRPRNRSIGVTITTAHLLLGLIGPAAEARLTAFPSQGLFYGEVRATVRHMSDLGE
ncbi:MAG: hypothetical protein ACP5KN_03310, partial [Armatimonadota bacterium]